MIVIIFGLPGAGKTVFLTHIANTYMYDDERNSLMQEEIRQLQANGFEYLKTIPKHCVSANYPIIGQQFRCSTRTSRYIDPFRLGFKNEDVKTHFNLPYEAIFIQEAQKYFNSRKSNSFPDWQSRWFEQHRHNHLDIFLDAQRADLIDLNIRELSHFIDIVKLKISYDGNDDIVKLTWKIRHIENVGLFEKYMKSGKREKSCYETMTITADYNVFECYESTSCKPKFYDGHMEEDFDYDVFLQVDDTYEGYKNYLKNNNDDMSVKKGDQKK